MNPSNKLNEMFSENQKTLCMVLDLVLS